MPKERICRNCGERFTPPINKPGYINDCGCLLPPLIDHPPADTARCAVCSGKRHLTELDKGVRFLWRNSIENLHVSPGRAYRWIVNEVYDGKPPSHLLWLLGVQS